MEHGNGIGQPSNFVCPGCNGTLWEIDGTGPARYRCRTGHGFTLRNLQEAMDDTVDEALWSAIEALQEKAALLRTTAELCRSAGACREASDADALAERVEQQAKALHQVVERVSMLR
jgi:two-component system chemotaxis response regulator CheB